MRSFKHNPHPIDLQDFIFGKNAVMGGRDFDQEEEAEDKNSRKESGNSGVLRSSVHKIRRSVSEKLFSIELGRISF